MLSQFLRATPRNYSTPPVLKVLSLDARDTLITLKESPSIVYSRFAKNSGLNIEPGYILENFLKHYKRMSSVSPCFGYNSGGSRVWWTEVVASTLMDCSPNSDIKQLELIANNLYDYYTTTDPWKLVEDSVKLTLQRLRLKGIVLVVTSNFDSRLKSLLSQFNLTDLFSMIILSGEVGFEKPDKRIYQLIIMDLFRKPKKRNVTTQLVRKKESSSDEEPEDNVKDFAKKRRRTNPMVQSTKKDDTRLQNVSDNSDDSDDDDNQSIAVATHSFTASGEAGPSGPSDQGATATLEVDTDYSRDAQAQFERVQQQLKDGVEKDGKILYKGSALYGAKEAKDTAKGNAASGYNRVGPVRAPQFLRQTVRWDFAPDICKDYKETGFCTFGDSCKFVHDRSDYKHGWEIDEEYEAGKYGVEDDTDYEIRDQDDAFPEDCFICGKPFVDPVVTKCKHYFCTDCALKAFQKSSKCPVCHQNTEKIMNAAKDLINFLKRKKKQDNEKVIAQKDNEEDEDTVRENCTEEHDHNHHNLDQEDGNHSEDDINLDHSENNDNDDEQEIVMEDVEGLESGENNSESDSEESDA